MGWAVASQGTEENGPQSLVVLFLFKPDLFGLGLETWFEFDPLSNSNHTQLNSKKTKENPTHWLYHIF
jgi:hypothetical protein